MNTVLITAIGSFSADIAIKTCKKMGFRVVGCDIYPAEWIVDSKNVSVFYHVPKAVEENYLNTIFDIIIKEKVKYILPSTDVEIDVLNEKRKEIESLGAVLCISNEKAISICRDKYKLYSLLSKHNIPNVIPTKLLSKCSLDEITFPIVCKPYNGRSSQGLHYIERKEQFSFLQIDNIDEYIIQPKIKGSIVTVDIVRQNKDKIVTIIRKELLRTLNGAGTSVYVYEDDKLSSLCKEIANILDVIGSVNFEFILDDNGEYHFIECNPRLSGGVEFSCIAGYNCIENHFNCFMGKEIDDFSLAHNMYLARKFEEYIMKTE